MALTGLKVSEPTDGALVAVDQIGSPAENYQIFKPAFGAPGDVRFVHAQQPLPSRDYYGGSVAFDSGLRAVAAGAPSSIGVDVDSWIDALLIVNLSSQQQRVSIEDGDGNSYGDQVLQANEWRVQTFAGFKFSGGFKVGAENASTVSIQVKGTQ